MGSTARHQEPGQTHLTVSPAKGLVRALSNRHGGPLKAVIPGMWQAMTLVISQAGLTPAEPSIACRALPVVLLEGLGLSAVAVSCRSLPAVIRRCDEPDFPEGHEDPQQSEELERQQDA